MFPFTAPRDQIEIAPTASGYTLAHAAIMIAPNIIASTGFGSVHVSQERTAVYQRCTKSKKAVEIFGPPA
jgi:hypothetical protein